MDKQVLMVPAVLTELLSDPELPPEVAVSLVDLPSMQISADYWQRTGLLRAKVLARGRRARLGDALIAQCCADEGVRLLTRDRDFRALVAATGVEILVHY
jgi:hypothetical protein